MDLKEKQAFWKGVVRGVMGASAFFSGLVVVIYYVALLVQMTRP